MKTTRVFVLAREPLFAQGVRSLISGQTGIEVVGVATVGPEALALMQAAAPDVVVIEARGEEQAALVAQVLEVLPQTKVVGLSPDDNRLHIYYAQMRQGRRVEDFLEAIRQPPEWPAGRLPALRVYLLFQGFYGSRIADNLRRHAPANWAIEAWRLPPDLAAVLDGLGVAEPVVLCGLSMGGYVAFQFWQRHARRLKSLILCDTRSQADTPEVKANRQQTAQRVLAEGPAFLAERMVERLFAPATRERRPDLIAAVREMILRADPEGVAAAALGMALRTDMTDRLGEICMPVLVIVGREDAISPPEEMGALAAAIRGAELVEIPDAGHMAPVENPAAFNLAIGEFLDAIVPLTG